MKAFTLMAAGLMVAVTGLVGDAQAGALDKGRVAADSQWVVHVDIQSFAASQLFKHVNEHGEELDIDMDDLEDVEDELGIDPLKDLLDLTVYGKGNPESDTGVVAVLTATAAIDELVTKLKTEGAEGYSTAQSGGYEISKFQDGDEPVFFRVNNGKNSQERIVVIGRTAEGVAKGLSVMDGKSPSLAKGGDASLGAGPKDGSYFFFTGINPGQWIEGMMEDEDHDADDDDDDDDDEDEDDDDHAEKMHDDATTNVLMRTKSIRVDVGEQAGTMYSSTALVTGNAQDAQDLGDMVNGFLAMGRLAVGSEPELKPLMNLIRAVKVSQDDTGIRVDFQSKVDDLIGAIKAMEAAEDADEDEDEGDDDAAHRDPGNDRGNVTISANIDPEMATLIIDAVARLSDSFGHEFEVELSTD